MSIKLEAGKHYKTRDGRKVDDLKEKGIYFTSNSIGCWYHSCGRESKSYESPEDIISEWHEPESYGIDATMNMVGDETGYKKLESILNDAFLQSSQGKGHVRHGIGLPFESQRMQTISQLIDSDAGMEFQAIKKLTEGLDMDDHDARRRELLGVIVYVAGIILYHDEKAKLYER